MESNDRKSHWEKVYQTKSPQEVSWTQKVPETSLNFIKELDLPPTAKIIDVGGGDSKLVDFLLQNGFENISVLDISEAAIEKAKERLGKAAGKVKWIVSDINDFRPSTSYDLWHDRATFHFLTKQDQKSNYLAFVERAVTGFLVIGTFSESGPEKCSGLEVSRYSEISLADFFSKSFEKIKCKNEDHKTPFDTEQNFVFCSLKRKNECRV